MYYITKEIFPHFPIRNLSFRSNLVLYQSCWNKLGIKSKYKPSLTNLKPQPLFYQVSLKHKQLQLMNP